MKSEDYGRHDKLEKFIKASPRTIADIKEHMEWTEQHTRYIMAIYVRHKHTFTYEEGLFVQDKGIQDKDKFKWVSFTTYNSKPLRPLVTIQSVRRHTRSHTTVGF